MSTLFGEKHKLQRRAVQCSNPKCCLISSLPAITANTAHMNLELGTRQRVQHRNKTQKLHVCKYGPHWWFWTVNLDARFAPQWSVWEPHIGGVVAVFRLGHPSFDHGVCMLRQAGQGLAKEGCPDETPSHPERLPKTVRFSAERTRHQTFIEMEIYLPSGCLIHGNPSRKFGHIGCSRFIVQMKVCSHQRLVANEVDL